MIKARKGQRVEFSYKGETLYGVVRKGGSNKITVVIDGGERMIKGHVSLFTESNHPLPESDKQKNKPLSKGMRVEFDYKGEKNYGVVSKGGSNKITVVIDGAKEEISGHVSLFTESNHPLPVDEPNVMDKWSVTGYKEIKGHGDTPTFEATICLNGKPVITAMNDGWGGMNMYHQRNGVNASVIEQLKNEAKQWAEQFGCNHTNEIEDIWVDWYVHKRPYGVTAKQELGEFTQMMAKYD